MDDQLREQAEEWFNKHRLDNEFDSDIKMLIAFANHILKLNTKLHTSPLKMLKHIKRSFDIQSDHSTSCRGYRILCGKIEQLEGVMECGTCVHLNNPFIDPCVGCNNYDKWEKNRI
jgi:hypothetical protein